MGMNLARAQMVAPRHSCRGRNRPWVETQSCHKMPLNDYSIAALSCGRLLFALAFAALILISTRVTGQTKTQVPVPRLADLAEAQQWDWLDKPLSDDAIQQAQPDGTTVLHWAVFYRNQTAVEKLIAAGIDVNQTNSYQVSPLSLACELGHEQAALSLIKAEADIESQRLGRETPLMFAARNGNVKIVNALIEAGANVDAQEVNGQTALIWAAAEGSLESLDALIEAKADINHSLKKSGYTAFLYAAREGKTDAAKRLLDAGADVNQVLKPKATSGRNPRKNMSALMLAVESGHFETALKLVEWGADPNDQRSGYGPLHAITWVRRTKLGDSANGDPPPRGSGGLDSLAFVRQLVAAGADVNLQLTAGRGGNAKLNTKQATPFLMASQTADVPLIKLLLELDADPTINNVDDCTPLITCAGIGTVNVGEESATVDDVNAAIKVLVQQCKLDVNAVDKTGQTPMHGAAYRSYPETVDLLTKLGADPKIWNQKNKYGSSPFDIGRGKRPGSLKPSPPTLAALQAAVDAQPVAPVEP